MEIKKTHKDNLDFLTLQQQTEEQNGANHFN